MARANVGVREGRWYWECKILSGVKPPNHSSDEQEDSGGHVRVGWARREASLDTPVGFDAYSYGLRDVAGQKVHMSRPKDFMLPNTSFCEGDVIGLEITLPSLALHRKIVEGSYNKAVDVSDDLVEPGHSAAECADIIRDRVPIRYKAHLYFEQFEYHSTKEIEELMNPSPVLSTTSSSTNNPSSTAASQPPNSNHPLTPLRTLPFSSINIYKNGQLAGTPFTNLLSFLPPASKPLNQVGARDGLDDGMLGYFPAISVFRGGGAEVNFGPDFWHPPSDLLLQTSNEEDVDMLGSQPDTSKPTATSQGSTSKLRPISERYNEQIAEDVVFDLVDEVDFWAQDGCPEEGSKGETGNLEAEVVAEIGGLEGMEGGLGGGGGEIKELVQEVE